MIDLGPVKKVFAEIRGICGELVGVGIGILLVGALFSAFQFPIPYVPKIDAYALMLTAAAFWLWQGKSLK